VFLGDHQHTLDAKGRVSLPAKFRGEMTGRIVVAKGLDNCLYVYPAEDYQASLATLLDGNDFDPRKRQVRRLFMAGAVETELDSAGRVSLPANLREYANLGKELAVIGVGDRIEIWDAEAWSAYNGDATENAAVLAQGLADAGLL
jgi:MraZ protein